jgi:hypothetical protein
LGSTPGSCEIIVCRSSIVSSPLEEEEEEDWGSVESEGGEDETVAEEVVDGAEVEEEVVGCGAEVEDVNDSVVDPCNERRSACCRIAASSSSLVSIRSI